MRVFVPLHLVRAGVSGALVGWRSADAIVCAAVVRSNSTLSTLDQTLQSIDKCADPPDPPSLVSATLQRLTQQLFGVSASDDDGEQNLQRMRDLLTRAGRPTLLGAWCDSRLRVPHAVLSVLECSPLDDTVRIEVGAAAPVQLVYFDAPLGAAFFVDPTVSLPRGPELWAEATEVVSVSRDQFDLHLVQLAHVRALETAVAAPDAVRATRGRVGALFGALAVRLATLLALPIVLLLWLQCWLGRSRLVAQLAAASHFAAALRERAELVERWQARAPLFRTEARCDGGARRRHALRVVQVRNDVVRLCADVLLGVLMALLLVLVARDVTPSLAAVEAWLTHDVVRRLIVWMMGWPAGFKLNGPLSGFIGALFLLFVDSWTTVVVWLGVRDIPSPLFVVALVGPLGVSVQLALVVDLLNVFTLHVRCFYLVAARLHAAQYSTLCSLWYLFRGRKYNVLRQRVDTLHHDLEQLLLGTVLFTALVFLAPTVAFYYVCFSAVALVLAAVRALMHAARHAVHTLPLYGWYALATRPLTLPRGVVFTVLSRSAGDTTHLLLRSVPLDAAALCDELRALADATQRERLTGVVGRFIRGTVREAKADELPGGVHVHNEKTR